MFQLSRRPNPGTITLCHVPPFRRHDSPRGRLRGVLLPARALGDKHVDRGGEARWVARARMGPRPLDLPDDDGSLGNPRSGASSGDGASPPPPPARSTRGRAAS